MYLFDTNVFSELRKRRPDPHVDAWAASIDPDTVYLSVLVIGEVEGGIARKERVDVIQAQTYRIWLERLVYAHRPRILPVTRRIAEIWGPLNAPNSVPAIDGLLAATALAHDLTLVTRNVRDVARTKVKLLNPFEPA